jgi:hypothetical protein
VSRSGERSRENLRDLGVVWQARREPHEGSTTQAHVERGAQRGRLCFFGGQVAG